MVQRYGASYLTIHRADLHQILLEALQALPEAHLNLNQAVSSYSEQDGVVTIRTSTGKLIEGDALIGADGVRSAVRAQMLGDGPPRVTGHLAYRAMVHQANLPKRLRTSEVTAWLGPQLHAIQYPVRRGELQNLVVIVQGPAPEDLDHWDHSANLPDCCSIFRALRLSAGSGAACARCGWRMALVAGGRPPAAVVEAQMAQGWWPCWAMPPIPCVPIWHRVRAWPSRMQPNCKALCPCMIWMSACGCAAMR
jgi:salicylate hydroxylase